MNKPLMLNPGIIPPAQAEALHDVALETERLGLRLSHRSYLSEEWDDETDDEKTRLGAEMRSYRNAQQRPNSSKSAR